MKKEPAVIIGAVEALILAVIGLVAALADWTPDATAAVVAVVAPTIAIVTSLVTRSKVKPA